MVRAAFDGDGQVSGRSRHRFGWSTAWRAARTAAATEIASTRYRKRLRFPQGSEVWIGGCRKFATAATSGLANPARVMETERPEPRLSHAVSVFRPNWSRVLLSVPG